MTQTRSDIFLYNEFYERGKMPNKCKVLSRRKKEEKKKTLRPRAKRFNDSPFPLYCKIAVLYIQFVNIAAAFLP